jgi:hypothetical protein
MKNIIIVYFLSYVCFFIIGYISGKLSNIKVSRLRGIVLKLYDLLVSSTVGVIRKRYGHYPALLFIFSIRLQRIIFPRLSRRWSQ